MDTDASPAPPAAAPSPPPPTSPASEVVLPEAINRLKEEGNAHFKAKEFAESITSYTDAISACPDYAKVVAAAASAEPSSLPVNGKALSLLYTNRALSYLRLEAYGAAAADAKIAIELDPKNPKAYYRLGSAHVALAKYKEGLAVFKIVARICPNDKDARAKLNHCQKEVTRLAFEAAIATEATSLPTEKIDLTGTVVPDSYTGPRWEGSDSLEGYSTEDVVPGVRGVGGITPEFVAEAVDLMKREGLIHKKYVLKLLLAAKAFLKPLPSLVRVEVPEGRTLTVCGDVHGQFYDLLNIFDIAGGRPTRENPYLFNGDFVDRGSFSVEVILTLFLYKALDPWSIHLLRGNHETKVMNSIYGFEGEVVHKYGKPVMDIFTEIFRYLPLCATINDKVVVMHGGLFQRDGVKLDEIAKIPRFSEPPDSGLFSDILWSDPQPFPGRGASKRGVGQSFGPDITKRFLTENNLELLVRSHEVRDEGFLLEHDGQLVTVFSAPNYCDTIGNKGAYIKFTGGPGGKSIASKTFHSFKHVPHPVIPPMRYATQSQSMFGL